jgi:hypothetical protein
VPALEHADTDLSGLDDLKQQIVSLFDIYRLSDLREEVLREAVSL